MEWAHAAIVLTGMIGMVGGLWGFFKFFSALMNRQFDRIEKRADLTDRLIRDLSIQLATMSGGSVGFVTAETCRVNSQTADDKVDQKIKDVREDLMGQIEAVEDRLSLRIERLEDR